MLAIPHRSARLVKKAINRTLVVAAAQNLLIHRLGLLQNQHEIESANFDHYIKLFAEWLCEVQAPMISGLFMAEILALLLVESADTWISWCTALVALGCMR
jgi:hypothetical protein